MCKCTHDLVMFLQGDMLLDSKKLKAKKQNKLTGQDSWKCDTANLTGKSCDDHSYGLTK